MRNRSLLVAVPAIVCAASLFLQSPGQRERPELIQELLKLPAPIPGSAADDVGSEATPKFAAPGEDAPLETLGRYWAALGRPENVQPTPGTRQRLLELCEQQPAFLPSLIALLPHDRAADARVKAIYDAHEKKLGEEWGGKIRKYLEFHGEFFRDNLVSEASGATDAQAGGYVDHSEELEKLAEVDWPRAEPVLRRKAAETMPRTAVLAKTLIYHHLVSSGGDAGDLRAQLKAVVADGKAYGYCRDRAAEALLERQWDGRDEWYLSLFHDQSLRKLRDGFYEFSPLLTPVRRDPDHWIPIMTRLVTDKDRAVHDAAVECLVSFHLQSGRRDALLPLLPWLEDRKWSSARDRLRLIQSMDDLDMQESIPGLIAVLQEEGNPTERAYAAESLAHFKDARAVPALRSALSREKEGNYRRQIISALIACGGVPATEAARAIEAFAEFTSTPSGFAQWEQTSWSSDKDNVTAAVALGGYIAENGPQSDQTIELLIKRAAEIKASQPAVAERLRALIAKWPSAVSDRATLRQLEEGSVSAAALSAALDRRASMQKTVNAELRRMEAQAGPLSAIAAVLLADREKEMTILKSGIDPSTEESLLACARLVSERLPIDDIKALRPGTDQLFNDTIDAYLRSDDREEARALYFSRHQKEAQIVGARENGDPGHSSFGQFDRFEERLQKELLTSDKELETVALLSAGYWGSAGQIVIRAEETGAELSFMENPARLYSRQISKDEWAALQAWLREHRVDTLGPLNQPISDGMQYEYVHLTRQGGRRVFMNNPGMSSSGGSVYDNLCARFWDLAGAAHLQLHYPEASKIPGFEVLFADPRWTVALPWVSEGQVRMFAFPDNRKKNSVLTDNGIWRLGETLPAGKKPAWISFADGRWEIGERPSAFPSGDATGAVPKQVEEHRRDQGDTDSAWQLSLGEAVYRVAEWQGKSGLWRFQHGHEPKLLLAGDFAWPVITQDGKWAVLAKMNGGSWAQPNAVIRLNLMSGAVYPLALAPADRIEPIAYVEARKRVLVVRHQLQRIAGEPAPVGPKTPEYSQVDPITGHVEIVRGEFLPLQDVAARPLQASAKKGQFWSAIPDRETQETRIGLYSPAQFVFNPVLRVPALLFDSQQMWVDERANQVYIAYDGHLLRLNLR